MVLSKVLSFGEGKELRRCQAMVPEINALEPGMQARSDAELRQLTDVFRKRLADGQTLDDLLPEAFAAVREASVRPSASATSTSSWSGSRCTAATSPR